MSIDPDDLPVGLSEWEPSPWEQEFIEDQTFRAQDETDTPEGA